MSNGYDERTGLYVSRYYARKERRGDEVCVKVDGGYKIMTFAEYNVYRKQR